MPRPWWLIEQVCRLFNESPSDFTYMNTEYSSRERFLLWYMATISFFGLNIAFIFGLFFQPGALLSALTNPISAAFIFEAFLLMAAFAYLLAKWGKSSLHWGWFVFLSLMGGMAFAVPVVLLWPFKKSLRENFIRK